MANDGNRPTSEPEWAAFVGLDWGDQKHQWKLQEAGSGHCEQGELRNAPEDLDAWASQLHFRFQGQPIAVCLEQSRGAVVYQLCKHAHLVLYPVHPKAAARFREACHPSGGKSDARDAAALLDLLMHHRDRLRRLDPESPQTRLLQMCVEQRRMWVDEKTCLSNRLTACLKQYFPQVLDWVDDIDSPMGCALLQQWPSLEALQSNHPGSLRRFFTQHNCRSQKRIQERLEAIPAARPAIQDAAMREAGPRLVQHIVALIQVLHKQIKELERRIAQLVQEHPEAPLFKGLPGVGPALLPRLIVAFGSDRQRYTSAAQLQAYSGVAPVTQQSGRSRAVHFRRACPKFLRQTFVEMAGHSIAKCGWARAYYAQHRSQGQRHQAAVRALAFKWLRVLFACWKNRTPYDEQIYLRALQNNRSRLVQILGTHLQWKEQAGFQKICAEKP